MADVLTRKQRRYNMSQIKGKDTKPEMVVRKLLHGLGYRYRLHGKGLPGRPDLVFAGRKKVVFVNGCYWHRHECELGRPVPGTRTKFWLEKFALTVERDRENYAKLKEGGWEVLVVWECELKDMGKLEVKLVEYLREKESFAK